MIWEPFLWRAALGGIGVALVAGPLGCFVVWRRMAYFGEATAHAAVLGVAISLATTAPLPLAVLFTAAAFGLIAQRLVGMGHAMDSALGVLAHGALAVGLVATSLVPGVRIDIHALLFGDILAVTWNEVAGIWAVAALMLLLLAWRWGALLTATLSPELARADGIDPDREGLILTMALAVLVALAIKVVGALLIVSMLIIPAAAVRPLASTPERMGLLAALTGVLAVLGGIWGSFTWDTPTGPSIVVTAGAIFALGALARRPGD